MKTRVLQLLLVAITFLIGQTLQGQFTRQQATNILITEVVGIDSLDSHHLYSCYETMTAGDTLWLEDFFGYYVCPYPEQWVFFVDDLPIAYWAHPCRIIFFDKTNGNYEINPDSWPPENFLGNHTQFLLDWEWILSVSSKPDIAQSNVYSVYPNPFWDEIQVKSNISRQSLSKIQLFDLSGKMIFSQTIYETNTIITLETTQLQTGLYFLNIIDKEGNREIIKVIKGK